MRWPIQIQLLGPMLSVVVLAIVLATAAGAYWGALQARRVQEENLRRVVATLAEATFPLSDHVLRQMSGLSGAEFVLFNEGGRQEAGTLPAAAGMAEELAAIKEESRLDFVARGPPIMLGDQAYLGGRLPVVYRGAMRSPGSLVVLYPRDRWTASIRQATYPALGAGLVAAAVAVLVTSLLARRFVRPIQQLGARAAVIANGDFTPMAVPSRNDEIRDLALSINCMTERLAQYESEVCRRERLRTLEQLGAGMAHQLRNAATGGRMAVELHRRECPIGADDESLEVALRQFRLMESYLRRFLGLGQTRDAPHRPVAVPALVEDILALVRPTCAHAGITLQFAPPGEPFEVLGDADALGQLLANLLLNAVEAAERQGGAAARVAVELERTAPDRGVLRVVDSGPGPAPGVQAQLFEPFVTDKPDGTGLGLFVARQIAEAHQGRIQWDRRGDATCFSVDFPLLG
jgi:signal transduction histidine kinase